MSIRIGASCVCDIGGSTDDCLVDEVRFEKNDRFASALNWVKHDISVGKYVIANITLGDRTSFLSLSETDWRNWCNHVVYNIVKVGANPSNCRLTIDNEPMEHLTKEQYRNYVNIAYDEIKFRKGYKFLIGAGNEEFDLAFAEGNMYDYLLETRAQKLCNFDVLDIHIQSSCNTPAKLKRWKDWMLAKKAEYNIKNISCTEANWMDVATLEGYEMLLSQCNAAEELGCSDFCIVFITLSEIERYQWLSFIYNNQVRSPYWEDFKNFIKSKKPIEKEEDMEFKAIYKRGDRGVVVKFIQEALNVYLSLTGSSLEKLEVTGVFDAKTDTAVRAFQSGLLLAVDGLVGRFTMEKLIEVSPESFSKLIYRWGRGER